MICPCCGQTREIAALECATCGARQIGQPLSPPDILLPKLGPSFSALACGLLVVVTFLCFWIFGNDMKVGRALVVWALGDATKFSQSLLQVDPKLPLYRIFSYDAYRLGFSLSAILLPLSLLGIWLGRRALNLARTAPARFGGASTAKMSIALCAGLFVIFSAVTLTTIPDALARGKAKKLAATRAKMYELHYQALQKYYREYGSYPRELSDLTRVNAEAAPQSDYWENNFNYQPLSVIASKGSAISLSNYRLVSAGPDGLFGTADDLMMVDGIVIDGPVDPDLSTVVPVPEKARR